MLESCQFRARLVTPNSERGTAGPEDSGAVTEWGGSTAPRAPGDDVKENPMSKRARKRRDRKKKGANHGRKPNA